jgi:serine/threonine protein kinase
MTTSERYEEKQKDTYEDTYEWNNYIIEKKSIGRGSFSKVYYGYHKDTKIEIALKKILFTALQNAIKDKVISEINILQKMDHLHIIKLYEYKFDGDYILLVTEYCKDNLEKWMRNPHTIEEKIEIMKQITNGIGYMHSNNILHRDIKPENILLHNGIIKICDFGFSTIIKENHQMMRTICGTPLFMSPEMLFMKPYTIKSEIWALGILFYMIIYRLHPFGILESLSDYRIKIKRQIIFIPINDHEYIDKLIEMMLSHETEIRPTVKKIIKILERETIDNDDDDDDHINEFNENELQFDEKNDESMEKSTCCFGTGRSRYELSLTINNDYFTPPTKSFSQPSQPDRSRSNSTGSSSFSSFFSMFKLNK